MRYWKALLLIVLSLLYQNVWAAKWVEIQSQNGFKHEVDIESIERTKLFTSNYLLPRLDVVVAWTRTTLQTTKTIDSLKNIKSLIQRQAFKCNARNIFDPVQVAFIDESGQVIDRAGNDTLNWDSSRVPLPETTEELTLNFVCAAWAAKKSIQEQQGQPSE